MSAAERKIVHLRLKDRQRRRDRERRGASRTGTSSSGPPDRWPGTRGLLHWVRVRACNPGHDRRAECRGSVADAASTRRSLRSRSSHAGPVRRRRLGRRLAGAAACRRPSGPALRPARVVGQEVRVPRVGGRVGLSERRGRSAPAPRSTAARRRSGCVRGRARPRTGAAGRRSRVVSSARSPRRHAVLYAAAAAGPRPRRRGARRGAAGGRRGRRTDRGGRCSCSRSSARRPSGFPRRPGIARKRPLA